MFKLVSLLAAGMFVILLIGGEDKGQMRQGLVDAEPVVATVAPPETPAAPVLANFTPVKVQAQRSAPVAGAFVTNAVVEVAVQAPVEAETPPVMYVSGKSVNVRGGPSTDYEVVGRLSRAEAVTVVSAEQDGWVQIRIEGDGIDGFIAARLLTSIDPAN